MVDYTVDIVNDKYASIADDPSYQAPGTYGLPTNFGATTPQMRIITLVEILRSYMAEIETTQEAKLLSEVVARMISQMQFGSPEWDGENISARAQKLALRFLAGHVISQDI